MKKFAFTIGILIGITTFAQEIDYSIAANYMYKYQNNSYQLKDTSIKVAWLEDVYDSRLKQTVSSAVLDDRYFNNVTGPEKAALAYVAIAEGNEYGKDGNPNAEGNGIKCKILSALKLGCLSTETNTEYFKNWFQEGSGLLKDIENCRSNTSSTSEQTTFESISVSTKDDIIKIKFTELRTGISKQQPDNRTEVLTFRLSNNKLSLEKRTKKK